MVRAFVNTVLGFLDVDDNTRTSVLDVLVPNLERDGITGEDLVYECVTEWIDRRSVPWRERERQSLDESWDDGSRKDFADPKNVDSLDVLLAYEENDPESVSFDEVKNILRRELPPEHFVILDFFLQVNNNLLEDKRYNAGLILSKILGFNDDEKLVRLIIGSYDVSERIKEKIILRASKKINELFIDGFDNIYQYISELVERWRVPYIEMNYVRLDRSINGDGVSLHEIFNAEDKSLIELDEEPKPRTLAVEVVDVLKGQIDHLDLLLIQQLLDKANANGNEGILLNVSPEDVLANAEQIQERITELAHRYERNGKIIIPRRPIIQVQFPLKIRFNQRSYNKNPLAFFLENVDVYGGMTRSKLQQFDSGLYDALYRTNQLELAIPKSYRGGRLREENVQVLIRTLESNNGCVNKTAKQLRMSFSTVKKYAIRNDVQLSNERGCPLSQERIAVIINTYTTYDGNASLSGRVIECSPTTVLKYWKKARLIQ